MAFTLDTTLGEILEKEGSKGIIAKYVGRELPDSMLEMAKGFPLKSMVQRLGMTDEKAQEFLAELNAL